MKLASTSSAVIRSATVNGKQENRTAARSAQWKAAVTRNSTVEEPTTIGPTLVQAEVSTRLFEMLRRSRPILSFVLCFRASPCRETILRVRKSDMSLKGS